MAGAVNAKITNPSAYRCVEAGLVEEWLVLYGWAYASRRGRHSEAILEARHALARWVDLGLGYTQTKCGTLRFDPAEVLNFAIMAARTGRDRIWLDRFVENGRDLVREFHSGCGKRELPPEPALLPPRRFHVRVSREFDLEGIEPGRQLLLGLPLPHADRALCDLKVESISPVSGQADLRHADGRLEWRVSVGPERSITVAADYAFRASPTVADPTIDHLTPQMNELYTRPSEGLIAVSARIAALADRIAGSDADRWRQLRRIWDFILDDLTCGLVHYDLIGAANPGEWVLDQGIFDCQLGSTLLISLCRALSIPARLVSGYLLYSVAPLCHYWAEVFIPDRGWVPVDLGCWNLSAGGQHDGWRNYFFGALDYRLKTEIFPHQFTGLSTIRLGAGWQILQLPVADGAESRFLSIETGRAIYCDRLVILPLGASNG
jgi:hypothetical protein